MLSERLKEVSDCAILGSARVDVKPIIEVGSGLDGGGWSERSWPVGPFVGSKCVGTSLSIVGFKRRLAKTLPANLDFGPQKGIWICRLEATLDMVEVKGI